MPRCKRSGDIVVADKTDFFTLAHARGVLRTNCSVTVGIALYLSI